MPHLRCFGLADFGPESFSVEPARHGRLQPLDFHRVFRINHTLGEFPQLVTTELPRAGKFQGVLNHFDLILGWRIVHCINNFGRGHVVTLLQASASNKLHSGRV
jgi:hypothetical protein